VSNNQSSILIHLPIRPARRVQYFYDQEQKAATAIQSQFRSVMRRRRFGVQQMGVIRIQAVVRMVLAKQRIEREAAAATVLQRGVLRSSRDYRERQSRQAAARRIQSRHRGRGARKTLTRRRDAALKLQIRHRGNTARVEAGQRKRAANIIQQRVHARHLGRQVLIMRARRKQAACS
jgi:hypothetical protein